MRSMGEGRYIIIKGSCFARRQFWGGYMRGMVGMKVKAARFESERIALEVAKDLRNTYGMMFTVEDTWKSEWPWCLIAETES